jgi:polysaccharide pyruvyl transferase WcaK-like protein
VKKFIFANNTGGTSNPGCQGTSHLLKAGLICSGVQISSDCPIGYYDSIYRRIEPPVLNSTPKQRLLSRFGLSPSIPTYDLAKAWNDANAALASKFAPLWHEADSIVLNGEGTIHHTGVGALTLLGFCKIAKELGKKVFILNCSIFDLEPFLLETLRDCVDGIAVREPLSLRYLSDHGVPATQAADCLFLIESGDEMVLDWPKLESSKKYALYTPGVLAAFGRVSGEGVRRDVSQLRQAGYEVFFHVVETEDERVAPDAAQAGARILPLGCLNWRQVPRFLRRMGMVVSGRYHINIFAALAGVPFIPLSTNTGKMAGVLELLSPNRKIPVREWGSATPDLDLNSAFLAEKSEVEKCRELAQKNFNFFV